MKKLTILSSCIIALGAIVSVGAAVHLGVNTHTELYGQYVYSGMSETISINLGIETNVVINYGGRDSFTYNVPCFYASKDYTLENFNTKFQALVFDFTDIKSSVLPQQKEVPLYVNGDSSIFIPNPSGNIHFLKQVDRGSR